jgi:hypothetical protein
LGGSPWRSETKTIITLQGRLRAALQEYRDLQIWRLKPDIARAKLSDFYGDCDPLFVAEDRSENAIDAGPPALTETGVKCPESLLSAAVPAIYSLYTLCISSVYPLHVNIGTVSGGFMAAIDRVSDGDVRCYVNNESRCLPLLLELLKTREPNPTTPAAMNSAIVEGSGVSVNDSRPAK